MKKLEGRTVLITGGAQGIGRVICERFLAEGAEIAIADFNKAVADATAAELSGTAGNVKSFFMNVADESTVDTAVNKIIKEFGKIDILVNNAGITRDTLMMRMKKEDWDCGAYRQSYRCIQRFKSGHQIHDESTIWPYHQYGFGRRIDRECRASELCGFESGIDRSYQNDGKGIRHAEYNGECSCTRIYSY